MELRRPSSPSVGDQPQGLAVRDEVVVHLVQVLVLELEPFADELRRRERDGRLLGVMLFDAIASDVVLGVLGRQEAGDLGDRGVEAAADVPPRRRLLLGDEDLGAAHVLDVDHRHRPPGRLLDALEDVHHLLVAGYQREAGRDAGIDPHRRRCSDGDDRAEGHQAETVLLRELGRLLLRKNLGDRVRLRRRQLLHGSEVLDVGPGRLVEDMAGAFQRPQAGDGGRRRRQDHALHRAGSRARPHHVQCALDAALDYLFLEIVGLVALVVHRSGDEEGVVAAGDGLVEAAFILQVGAKDLQGAEFFHVLEMGDLLRVIGISDACLNSVSFLQEHLDEQ